MRRVHSLAILLVFLLAACGGGTAPPAATPDAQSLLDETIANIQQSQNFRMILEQRGAEYPFSVYISDDPTQAVTAVLRRAEAQFVAPHTLYAQVNLRVAGAPLALDVYAAADDQWLRLPPLPWLHQPFAPEFNPLDLLSPESGFQRALSALSSLSYVGLETLDDGTQVYHLRGMATGESVRDLLMGLLERIEDVVVDVYIDTQTMLPALVVITQPDSAPEGEEDTYWNIEIYDYDSPSIDIVTPEAAS